MSYTPVEIRHVKLRRGLFGYRREPVDRLLEQVGNSFETVWRERADHADRIDQLEAEVTRYRDLESLLRATLVSAQKAAQELRGQAQREADSIVSEAHAEARLITREARGERETIALEARRIRVLLHAALESLDEADREGGPAGSESDREPRAA